MAKQQKNKPEESNLLAEAAKEFLQCYPKEDSGLIASNGTPFLNREKRDAVKYCETNNLLLWEYTAANGKIELVTINNDLNNG